MSETNKKADFHYVLSRRKSTIESFVKDKGFETQEDFTLWMKANEEEYTFTDAFVEKVSELLKMAQPPPSLPLPKEEEPAPTAPPTLPKKPKVVTSPPSKKEQES